MEWSEALSSGLLLILDSGSETDFELSCTDGNVRCHRAVLMAQGGVLAKKVEERLADNVSRLDISRLHINQKTAMLILKVLYGGLKEQLQEGTALQFLQFAHHFDVNWMKHQLMKKFGDVLSPKNCLQLYGSPEVKQSTQLTQIIEEYYSSQFSQIVEQGNLSSSSLEGVTMVTKLAGQQDSFNCFKLFIDIVNWLLANNENTKSAAQLLGELPLKKIEVSKLQNEVYDMIFNLLIIGKGDVLTQEDKVKLSGLYQAAVRDSQQVPQKSAEPEVKVEILDPEVMEKKTKNGKGELENCPETVVETSTKKSVMNGDCNDDGRKQWVTGGETVRWDIPVPGKESIISHIQSGEWPNMEYPAVRSIISHENILETEFVAVESIFLWIAADNYRKQHCEDLLRACRFSDVCPVYIRCVLTTFVTEKMVGSARLANNILRSPSGPRSGSAAPGRLAGVVDDVPLSVQRLQLGEHALTAKCSKCGSRCQVVLRVSRSLPTAVVSQLPCTCGPQRIVHTACASTLTPDVFPSMHLLPFHHLSRLLSSMDDMRIYLFKLQQS